MSTTLYRIGNRVFSMDAVEEVNLEYDPKRFDKAKPPSTDAGVEIILGSGRRLDAFWGAEARLLRDYLAGLPVDVATHPLAGGLRVLHLLPAPVAAEVPAPAEPGTETVSTLWGGVELPAIPAGIVP